MYLVTYVAVALLGRGSGPSRLVAALTRSGRRDIRVDARRPYHSDRAGDLFIVLPALIDATKPCSSGNSPPRAALPLPCRSSSRVVQLPPHTGKLLTIASPLRRWFADAVLCRPPTIRAGGNGLAHLLRQPHAAPVPARSLPLSRRYFHSSSPPVRNSRVGSLVAAMHTVTVALLGGLRHRRARCVSIG